MYTQLKVIKNYLIWLQIWIVSYGITCLFFSKELFFFGIFLLLISAIIFVFILPIIIKLINTIKYKNNLLYQILLLKEAISKFQKKFNESKPLENIYLCPIIRSIIFEYSASMEVLVDIKKYLPLFTIQDAVDKFNANKNLRDLNVCVGIPWWNSGSTTKDNQSRLNFLKYQLEMTEKEYLTMELVSFKKEFSKSNYKLFTK